MLLAVTFMASAQSDIPVAWQVTVKMTSPTEGILTCKARLADGWHLYGTSLPEFGPKPTQFDLDETVGVEFTESIKPDRQPLEIHDEMFDLDLNWWDSDIAFRVPFTVSDPENALLSGKITFMSCNNQTCSPPETYTFSKEIPAYKSDKQ